MTKKLVACLILAASAAVQAQEWKTFSDAKIGVELKYPANWTHRRLPYPPSAELEVEIFEAPNPKDLQGDFWVQLNPSNPKNLAIERWFEEFKRPQHKDPSRPQIGKVGKAKVDGQAALSVVLNGNQNVFPCLLRYVARPGGKVFVITEVRRQGPDKGSPILEKMAASVKFLKK